MGLQGDTSYTKLAGFQWYSVTKLMVYSITLFMLKIWKLQKCISYSHIFIIIEKLHDYTEFLIGITINIYAKIMSDLYYCILLSFIQT